MVNLDKTDAVETPIAEARRSLLPDPAHIWAAFRRRWPIFFVVVLAALAIAAALILSMERRYAATAVMIVEPRPQNVITFQPGAQQSQTLDSSIVDTEVQIIGSPAVAERVVRALQLSRYPEYAPAPTADAGAPRPLTIVNRLLRNVAVDRTGTSYAVTITAQSGDPDLAAAIANAFAQQYIQRQNELKTVTTRTNSDALNRRLDQLRGDVVSADAALQRYTVQNGLMSAQGATMAEQEVSELNRGIALAQADVAEKVGRLAAARSQIGRGGGGADVGAALGSSTISDLRRQEAEASRQLADLSARYGDLFPDVQKARKALADVRSQIQLEINRILSSLSAEVQSAQSRLASLQNSRGNATGTLAANSTAQTGLLDLTRKAEAARAVYSAFLEQAKETASEEGLSQANARIDNPARAPALPFTPNYRLAAAFAAAVALLLGLIAVALAEYFDQGIRTKADIEQRLRIRYLGAVPALASTLSIRNPDAPHEYLVNHPYSAFAEAIRNLRVAATSGTRGANKGKPHVLAITSALPREGKSTTSICLARSLALSGVRTVIVDCDIRRRQASELLLPAGADGLLRYLDGAATLETALMLDAPTGLMVLGTTQPPREQRDLFAPGQLEALLSGLRARFDVIVLDTAPVLGIAETRTVAAAADATLMLARWRKTSVKAVDAAVEMLLGADVRLLGAALTVVDIRKFASTGADDYTYHSKFGGYYQN